jgi:phosphonate transport system ATP-binding protein
MKYLKKINEDLGITIICNLHFLSLVREYGHRVLALKNGEIVYQGMPAEIDQNWFKKIYGEDAKEIEIN